MTLATILITAILSAAPQLDHASATRYGTDMASAAGSVEDGIMLVATAAEEGGFRKQVETCAVTGDGGDAISLYQLHKEHLGRHTREEVCASNRLATRLAMASLARVRRIAGTAELSFARYIGVTRLDDVRVRRRTALYQRLLTAAQAE
jgi:hypothetical protein